MHSGWKTPVHLAAANGQADAVGDLLVQGADMNFLDGMNKTSFGCSVASCRSMLDKVLPPARGANRPTQPGFGPKVPLLGTSKSTPASKIPWLPHSKFWLIEASLLVAATDAGGLSPLYHAVLSHVGFKNGPNLKVRSAVVKFLHQNGANIWARSTSGQCPIHITASNNTTSLECPTLIRRKLVGLLVKKF